MSDKKNTLILDDVKDALGIPRDLDHFDTTIIMYINSAFATLNQLGVGPEKTIILYDGKEQIWAMDNFNEDVKMYITLFVRINFDPPTNAFLVDSLQKQMETIAWRMSTQAEYDKKEGG